jgi:hypothetical protein
MAKKRTRIKTYRKVKFIDDFIDLYKKARHNNRLPREAIKVIVPFLFPGAKFLGKGFYKIAFYIPLGKRKYVLKFSHSKHLGQDFKVYYRIPENIRNRYFAKIYWTPKKNRPKYCILQKYAKQPNARKKRKLINNPQFIKLKVLAKKYRITDIRPDNVGFVDNKLKILDASLKR